MKDYEHIKILSDKTADYIEKSVTDESKVKMSRYNQCWNDMVHIIDRFLADTVNDKGIVLDKTKILDIICHNAGDRKYWNLNMGSKGKMMLTYYYHKSDNIYSIVRSRGVTYSEIPIYIEIGNCIIIVDNVTKQAEYLSNNRKLFYVHRIQNDYIGYRMPAYQFEIKNNFTKSA